MKRVMQMITVLGLVVGVSGAVHADLVTNGGFEALTYNDTYTGPGGQLGYNTTATGWSVDPNNITYNFVFTPGTVDTIGTIGQYGALTLYGPGNRHANGLGSSPDGGNFLAADGAYETGPIFQTIATTEGQKYDVGFYWGAAQQQGYSGLTTNQWQVKLGGQELDTPVASIPEAGFSGWMHTDLIFTAGPGNSSVLSFLANGTPAGQPPFALLDGVTANAVTPEGSSLSLLSMGLLGLGGISAFARRRANAAI